MNLLYQGFGLSVFGINGTRLCLGHENRTVGRVLSSGRQGPPQVDPCGHRKRLFYAQGPAVHLANGTWA